jgi:hypothetical protein
MTDPTNTGIAPHQVLGHQPVGSGMFVVVIAILPL